MEVVKFPTEDGKIAYLLLDDDRKPIEPVAKYMKSLHNRNLSSNTLKTYCQGLKPYFIFLQEKKKDYTQITYQLLSDFVGWLKNPYRSTKVTPLKPRETEEKKKNEARLTEKSVNLYLTAVLQFYAYLIRTELLDSDIYEKVMIKVYGPKGYKSFLHHVDGNKTHSENTLKLKEPKEKAKIFTKEQVEKIYQSTTNIRDRFLVHLLFETGLRIGEVLALFFEDFKIDHIHRNHKIQLTDRGELPNGGKLKTGERKLDVSQELMNLYDDYVYEVIDHKAKHNFVFVKLWGENPGSPITYSDVYATFKELEKKTGIYITPHIFRHTHGTIYYLETKNIKMVQERLGHAQVQTTIDLYVHVSEDEIRKDWEKAAHAFKIGQKKESNEEGLDSHIPDEIVPF